MSPCTLNQQKALHEIYGVILIVITLSYNTLSALCREGQLLASFQFSIHHPIIIQKFGAACHRTPQRTFVWKKKTKKKHEPQFRVANETNRRPTGTVLLSSCDVMTKAFFYVSVDKYQFHSAQRNFYRFSFQRASLYVYLANTSGEPCSPVSMVLYANELLKSG